MKNSNKEFWITNISKMNVSLGDLYMTAKAGKSVNLFSKHYNFTEEQVYKSASEGSIYAKRDKIKLRTLAPSVPKPEIPKFSKAIRVIPSKTTIKLVEKTFEEISDSSFFDKIAEENED